MSERQINEKLGAWFTGANVRDEESCIVPYILQNGDELFICDNYGTEPWSPTTNIAQAWACLEKMLHETSGKRDSFDIDEYDGKWSAHTDGEGFNCVAIEDTAQLAICRAVLAFVEGQ